MDPVDGLIDGFDNRFVNYFDEPLGFSCVLGNLDNLDNLDNRFIVNPVNLVNLHCLGSVGVLERIEESDLIWLGDNHRLATNAAKGGDQKHKFDIGFGHTCMVACHVMTTTQHPAKFSRKIIGCIDSMLLPGSLVLDSFAGTGRIHWLQEYGHRTIGIELEPEWANMHEDTIVGNALFLPFKSESFDAFATSCTYGNRMADSHNAKDASARNTYTHKLGRKLHPDNSGAMQWGDAYRQFHTEAWTEAIRVIKPGGRFVLNVKDHIRAGSVVPVTEWHNRELIRLGLDHVLGAQIKHSGNGFGQNGKVRVPYESVILFMKP